MKKTFTILITALLLSHFAKAQSQQYLHFDRMDDFVEVPEGSKFISGSDQITMAGWFWTDELVYGQGMMAFRNGGTGDGEMYIIQLENGILECRLIINGDFYEFVGPAFTIPVSYTHLTLPTICSV